MCAGVHDLQHWAVVLVCDHVCRCAWSSTLGSDIMMWRCVQVCMIFDTGLWYYYVTMCAGVHDLQCRRAVSHWVRGHRGVGICAHRVHEPSPHQVHAALLSLIQLWHHFVSWNNLGSASRKQSCLEELEASFKILGDEVWSPYVSKASALRGACRTMQSYQWCVCVYVCM